MVLKKNKILFKIQKLKLLPKIKKSLFFFSIFMDSFVTLGIVDRDIFAMISKSKN